VKVDPILTVTVPESVTAGTPLTPPVSVAPDVEVVNDGFVNCELFQVVEAVRE